MQYDHKITEQQAIEMLRFIDSRPDYELWTRIISAVGNHFDETTAVRILRSRFTDEKPNETIQKVRSRMKNISIATLIYHAKLNGYIYKNAPHKDFFRNTGKYSPNKEKVNQSRFVPLKNEIITKSIMPNIHELPLFVQDVIRQHIKDGIHPDKALEIALKGADFLRKDVHAFTVSVNKQVLNKNLDPATKKKHNNFLALTHGFENLLLTKDELIHEIGTGRALVFAQLKSVNGKIKRETSAFVKTNIFAVDIDSGLTLETVFEKKETQNALLIYTSVSHTEQSNRFRIVFGLPSVIDNIETFNKIIQHYICIFGADKSCKDPARAFFGNSNADVYDIESGSIYQFRDGVQND